ncbi:chemotaxis protein [Pseudomonas oryzihabitans]|nr:chemotaxis protein [Pseudomonas psychrotolerans]
MGALLTLGIGLLGRFSFARKFQLLFVLFLVPMGISLWLLGLDFKAKLDIVAGERAGVHVLQTLDAVETEVMARRNLAARWKAWAATNPTAAEQALAAMEARQAPREKAMAILSQRLAEEMPGREREQLLAQLKTALAGLDSASLRGLDAQQTYDRFTAALGAAQALREKVATDSGLILDPWLETYLLMQLGTDKAVDLSERLGRLESFGEPSVVAGNLSLQNRLELRDLRTRIGDSLVSMTKSGNLLQSQLPPELASWAQDYRKVQATLESSLKTLDAGVFGERITLSPADFESTLDGALGAMATFRSQVLAQLDSRLDYYGNQTVRNFTLVLVLFASLLLLTCYMLLCMQVSIRRGAAGITTLADSLRDGDLTQASEVAGRDELATISRSLNTAVVQLRQSLQGVDRETQQLGVASQQLGVQSGDALVAVEDQQQQITQIVTAANELAATAQGVAQSCEQAAGRAEQMRDISARSQQDSRQTTASIQQLNTRLSETATAMGQVSDQAGQIRQVVDVIRSIAEQTNLLALNAAIEAARAGDQGRGFAVVADEVRSLSQRTQASTAQIAGTVGSLSETVTQAVTLMREACGQAENDALAVTGLGRKLEEITQAVEGVSDTLTQIATAAEEQAVTADQVSGNIQQVDVAANRLLGNARQVQQAAEGLGRGSKTLAATTARFRLG